MSNNYDEVKKLLDANGTLVNVVLVILDTFTERFLRYLVYIYSESKMTAMHHAAMNGNVKIVELLIEYEADCKIIDGQQV